MGFGRRVAGAVVGLVAGVGALVVASAALAAAPANVGVPVVSGSWVVGQSLTATSGSWLGSPTSYSYVWQQCSSERSTVLAGAPVGYWRFGEASGSSAANAGSSGGAASIVGGVSKGQQGALSGDPDTAFAFDGSTGYVQSASNLAFGAGAFSVEAWVRISSIAAYPTVIHAGYDGTYGWSVYMNGNGTLQFSASGSSASTFITSPLAYDDGSWHQVVATRSAGTYTLYVDGAQVAQTVSGPTGQIDNSAKPTLLGAAYSTSGSNANFWNGSLDEVAVYPSSLSAADVLAHYQAATAVDGTGCAAISGASSASYVLASGDVGHRLRATVTATNADGSSSSSSYATLAAGVAPVSASAPTLIGTVKVGQTVTVSDGVWSGSDPMSFSYQWQDCTTSCTDITGATTDSFTFAGSDSGKLVRARVTASNLAGSATADTVTVTVAGAPPAVLVRPVVSGTLRAGQVLSVSDGAWSSRLAPTFTYQWQRCSDYAGMVMADNPAGGYWRLGEPSGTSAADGSGGRNTGTLAGGATLGQPGAITADLSSAVSLNGSSGSMQLTRNLGFGSGAFSVEAWFKTSGGSGYPTLFQAGYDSTYGWSVYMNPSGTVQFSASSATSSRFITSSSSYADGQWHLLVATRSGATYTLYVDGGQVAQSTSGPADQIDNSSKPTVIGAGYTSSLSKVNYWNGAIDEVAVYPAALSSAQVSGHYTAAGCSALSSTSNSATLSGSEVGMFVRAQVTATSADGTGASWSVLSGPVQSATSPVVSSAPTVTGVATIGQTLTAARGTWTGVAPITYAYQWQRCPDYATALAADSPQGYWRLGEATGSTAAAAVGSNTGTYYGGVSLGQAGALQASSNTAVGLNGSTGYLQLSSNLGFGSGAFSVEAWFKTSGGSGYPTLFQAGYDSTYGWSVYMNPSGTVQFSASSATSSRFITSSSSYADGQWHLLVATRSGATYTLYVDGGQVAQSTSGPADQIDNSSKPTVIGAGYTSSLSKVSYWNGAIDEVAVYPAALSSAQVSGHYTAAGCTAISGATGTTYPLAGADVGFTVRVKVTAANSDGQSVANSAATALVGSATIPVNTTVPAVSGIATVGRTLTATTGAWSGASPISYSYQWLSCGIYSDAVAADSPSGYWRLGEPSGSSAGDSAGSNTGTYTGGYTLGQTGVLGAGANGAVALDGSSAYVQLGSTVQFETGPFSVEAWFKTTANSHAPTIWESGFNGGYPDVEIYLDTGGLIRSFVRDAGGTTASLATATGINDNAWHHIVLTRSGASEALFLDGTQVASTASGPTGDVDTAGVLPRIGNESINGYSQYFWNGLIDEVATYTSALTATQVHNHAQAISCQPISGATSAQYTLTTTEAATTVKVQVTATNASGTTAATSTLTAAVQATAPQQLMPNPEGGVHALQPTLTVAAISGQPSASYQFQVSADQAFQTGVTASGWLASTTSWTVGSALTDNQSYWWRAQARYGTITTAWSDARKFTVRVNRLGSRPYWPVWSAGPVAVNEATGNLILRLPGPSFATPAALMGVEVSYNSQDSRADQGLGQGWTLSGGNLSVTPPSQLVDHALLSGADQYDMAEVVWPDGGSSFYAHVANSGTYNAAPGDTSQLQRNRDSSWTLTDVDGSIYTFGSTANGASYRLATAEVGSSDPGASQLTYTFTASGSQMLLTTILDQANPTRQLTLYWHALASANCPSAILCVSGPDNITWQYVGDGTGGYQGRISKVNDGIRDLYQITYATSGPASGKPTGLLNANDLSAASASPDPNLIAGYSTSHRISFGYDSSSPVRITSVSEPGISGRSANTGCPASAPSCWLFAYTSGSTYATQATARTHDGLPAGTARLAVGTTTITGPTEVGKATPKQTTVYIDDLDHPIQTTDPLGHITLAGFNSHDEQTWTEDALGNATDTAWDTVNDIPLTVTQPDLGAPKGRPVTHYYYDEAAPGTISAGSYTPGTSLTGVQAFYFANSYLTGRPTVTQTDPAVDFNWGASGPPVLGGQTSGFSVRWQANLTVPVEGDYSLQTVTNGASEGTRVTIDQVKAIDNWTGTTLATATSSPIHLTAGLHKLIVDYYNTSAPAQIRLNWACSACSPNLVNQPVDTGSLTPGWNNRTSTVSPEGRPSFTHYDDPARARSDYTVAWKDNTTKLVTTSSYDAFGRVTSQTSPLGNTNRSIQANGVLTGSSSPAYTTSLVYYAAGATAAAPALCSGGSTVNQAQALKQIIKPGQAATSFVYDQAGRTISVTDGAGTTCAAYTLEGRLQTATDRNDNDTGYRYLPAGEPAKTILPTGAATRTVRDEADGTTQTIDPNGHTTTFTLDAAGQTLTATDPAGRQTSIQYDAAGNKTASTDPAGKTTSYDFTDRNQLWKTHSPLGEVTTNSYDALGRQVAVQDANLISSSVDYDNDGNKTSSTDGRTKTTHYAYDLAGRLTQTTDPRGNSTTIAYDANSEKTQLTAPDNGVTQLAYDTAGNLTSKTDPLSHVTYFAYDGVRRLIKTTQPTGEITRISYDANGNKLTSTDAAGKTTRYAYDSLNRLIAVTTPKGETSTTGYDWAGNVLSRTDELGKTTSYGYNAADQLLAVTDPLGHTTSTSYDTAGRVSTRTDANGNVTSYGYDDDSRISWVQAPDGDSTHRSSLTYDAVGNVLTRTDARGKTTTWSYNQVNQVASMVDALGDLWTYCYDDAGNRSSVTDANGNHTVSPTTDGITSYSYDNANRLSGIDYSDSTADVGFHYDAAGNRDQMLEAGSVVESYSYDSSNRLTGVTRSGVSFSYSYANGRLASRQAPGAAATSYAYDDDGQLASATTSSLSTSFTYDAAGRLTQTGYPNGWTQQRGYDDAGRLTLIQSVKSGSSNLAAVSLTLDANGNPTQISRDGQVESYSYDSMNRVTAVCYGAAISGCPAGSLISYAYDRSGNRTSQTRLGTTTSYSYNDADQLTQTAVTGGATTSLAYDYDGQLTSSGTRGYVYDLAGRVTTVTDSGSTTASFAYDGNGNRLSKTAAGVTTSYRWDENASLPMLAQELTGGSVTRSYQYGADTGSGLQALSVSSAGSAYYLHADQVGSTAAITNPSGGIEWTYTYDPYGQTRSSSNPGSGLAANAQLYAGQLYDAETGLYDMRARLYDPQTGRFLSTDPMPLPPTQPAISLYAYADDSPLLLSDPSGNRPIGEAGEVITWKPSSDSDSKLVATEGASGASVSANRGEIGWVDSLTSEVASKAYGKKEALPDVTTEAINIAKEFGTIPIAGARALIEAVREDAKDRACSQPIWKSSGWAFSCLPWAIDDLADHPDRLGYAASVGLALRAGAAGLLARGTTASEGLSWEEQVRILRTAARSKGNYGLGSASADDANSLGRAWVGDKYTIASDGKTMVSSDGFRAYRPPTWKPKLGKYQANFEYRVDGQITRKAMGNGHLDITDLP